MNSLALKVGKAPIVLKQCERTEEAFFDVLMNVESHKKKEMKQLISILDFCDREPEDIEIVVVVVDELLRGKKPCPKDARRVTDIIGECKEDLMHLIDEEVEVFEPLLFQRGKEFERYKLELKSMLGEKVKHEEERRKTLIKDFVYERPGEYIKSLAERLQVEHGMEGLSYENIRRYIGILEKDKEIITIGGPQGRYKYCFPNPSKVDDLSRYYHGFFAIEGRIEKNITDYFDPAKMSTYTEMFIVNSTLIPKFLLAVGYGELSRYDDIQEIFIKSYGDLEPFIHLPTEHHLTLYEERKAEIKEYAVLFGRKVVKTEDGKEKELWVDKDKEDLHPPLTLIS